MSSKEDKLHEFVFADTKRNFVPVGELAARMFVLDCMDVENFRDEIRRDFSQIEEKMIKSNYKPKYPRICGYHGHCPTCEDNTCEEYLRLKKEKENDIHTRTLGNE